MKNDIPTGENFKALTIEKAFKPLLKELLASKQQPGCKDIKGKLDHFKFINLAKLQDNSTYVCFDNLKRMYSDNVIPENVFWITSVNANPDDSFIQPHTLIEQLNLITQQIKSNSFNLTHEWYFDHEGNSGIFLHCIKPVNNTHHFISIFVAYKNIDGSPTLTKVKNGKK
jgi:hypothetical protein